MLNVNQKMNQEIRQKFLAFDLLFSWDEFIFSLKIIFLVWTAFMF